MTITSRKKELRKEMALKRNAMSKSLKEEMDESICAQLLRLITQRNAKIVHTYIPMGSEINLTPLIHELLELGIQRVCPKTLPKRQLEHRYLTSLNELEEGVMKTFHPKEARLFNGKCDLIIVPGLAYDENNYRLGYGGGYYDEFLMNQKGALKVGAFYSFQKVNGIPVESHDQGLDLVIIPE